MSDALTTGLRPPPEHDGKKYHWLSHSHDKLHESNTLFRWSGLLWWRNQDNLSFSPAEAAKWGWSYVRPYDPARDAPVPAECTVHRWRSTQAGSACPYCGASDGGAHLMAQKPEPTGTTEMRPPAEQSASVGWKPSEADVESLTIALIGAFHKMSFGHARNHYANMALGNRTDWRDEARAAFNHAPYLPSIAAARQDHAKRVAELEAKHVSLERTLVQAQQRVAELKYWNGKSAAELRDVTKEAQRRIEVSDAELRGTKSAMTSMRKADDATIRHLQSRIADLEREQCAEDEERNWSA